MHGTKSHVARISGLLIHEHHTKSDHGRTLKPRNPGNGRSVYLVEGQGTCLIAVLLGEEPLLDVVHAKGEELVAARVGVPLDSEDLEKTGWLGTGYADAQCLKAG